MKKRKISCWGPLGRFLTGAALLVTSLAGADGARAEKVAVGKPRLAAVERAFADAVAKSGNGGLTVGIVADGRLIWTRSYGFADRALGRRADRQTVYRIGSITKQFTAIAYLKLLAEGRLQADQRVADVYPPLRAVRGTGDQIASITFDALASHRSGLAREPEGERFLTGPIEQWDSILAEALSHTAVEFPALDKPHYSNIGYGTLGAALGAVSGIPYIDLIERSVIAPLKLKNTGFRPSQSMLAHLARGYEIEGHGASSTAADTELRNGRGYKIPNGGLFTTIDDLARFVAFEMDGAPGILSQAALEANRRQFYAAGEGNAIGRGFQQLTPDFVGHGGAVSGFLAGAFFDPGRRLGIVCLRNVRDEICTAKSLQPILHFISVPGAKLELPPVPGGSK